MKNLTLFIFAIASLIASLSFLLASCNTGIEAQDILEPSTLTADDLATILEGMPISDVKEAILKIDPDVRTLIGVQALNSLNSVSDELAFDTGKLLEGEVRDGAASALLDELVNACLMEVPHLIKPDLTNEEMEEFVNSSCFTDMRRKFKDLNQLYSVVLEEALAKQYTLPPLD